MSDQANQLLHPPAESAVAGSAEDGRVYWRSLEQLAGSAEYASFLHREFQDDPDRPPADAVSRRRFLGLVAAAVAMASTTACRKPVRKILPFSQRPEDLVPGVPRYYATAFAQGGYGTGMLVRSSDGRPTKVEGNPLHPASLGGADVYMQGELLNLYDPARSRAVCKGGQPAHGPDTELRAEFDHFVGGLSERLGDGAKLALLLGPTTSPSTHQMVARVRKTFPQVAIHTYRPLHRDHAVAGAKLAFGKTLDAQCAFDRADVIVALDCDFLGQDPNGVRNARDFAGRRRAADDAKHLNRLYAVESGFSLTGGQADHRFRVRAHQVTEVALALAAELGVLEGDVGKALAGHRQHEFRHGGVDWVAAIAKDLREHRGRGLIVAGPRQPAVVHAIAHALNAALGNVGTTVRYSEPPELAAQEQVASLRALVTAMGQGSVDTLFILGGNPVYDAPADLDFRAALAKVPHRVHLGLYRDETAALCDWHVPAAHDLEAWGDIRSWDGTVAIVQPLIAPLYAGVSELELLARIGGNEEKEGHLIVRYHWEDNVRTEDFDAWWHRVLHDGLVHDSAYPAVAAPELQSTAIAAAVGAQQRAPAATAQSLEVTFHQDALIYDGRYANNAWMQECPDPITKLTWDNAALISRATAGELDLANGDVVALTHEGRTLEIPVWIAPGQADHSIALPLGYGRHVDGFEVAKGAGFDTYRLRGTGSSWLGSAMTLAKTGRHYPLRSTQHHGSMEGRALYRAADLAQFEQNPTFAPEMSPLAKVAKTESSHSEHAVSEKDLLKSLWKERDYTAGYQWGMVIDLNSCNGCNACVVACQSENNIPTVGKEEVAVGREMHWLRIDRYFTTEDPQQSKGANVVDGLPRVAEVGIAHQPVPCMQCENAPCESVCPVAATTHSPEGLNDMAYNRCIGTRYCNNNCPYKVRRFNWFDFAAQVDPPTLRMVQNPDVTVRSRGVMEKCTYCVQRINRGKITAKNERRDVLDGEIVPACAQSCPSQAITFGNIADQNSRVAQLKRSPLNYAMLSELNVKPRTTYLAKVRNPNPELS